MAEVSSISPDATAKPDYVSVMHFHYCISCLREEWETVSGIVELGWGSIEEAEAALGESWMCAFCQTVAEPDTNVVRAEVVPARSASDIRAAA